MKKIMMFLLVAAVTLIGFQPSLASATPAWNVVSSYTIEFTCTSGCSGVFPHTMNVATMDPVTGDFTGTGFFNPDPTITWDVTGNVNGSAITYQIVYNNVNAGYTVNGVGTISSTGTLSGTATGPGQTFTWQTTTGAAVELGTLVVNGGGHIMDAAGKKKLFTFGTDVVVFLDGSFGGHFNLVDHVAKVSCDLTTITNLVVAGNQATFTASGNCNNGGSISREITVVDHGEPGTGVDQLTVSGTSIATVISGGNLQVHDVVIAPPVFSETYTLYADGSIGCTGADDLSDPDGSVTVTAAAGAANYTINLMDAEPNRTYSVAISREPSCSSPSFPGTFTTDASGNGTFSNSYTLPSGTHTILVNMSTDAAGLSDPRHREISTTEAVVIIP
jgi:hypothetical protein